MAVIDIKSYNEILGDLVRSIKANSSLSDIHSGSVLLTLLEAIASNDFENNVSILNVLELLNIDVIANNDLDAYASNLNMKRLIAVKSSGFIKISDTAITKRSTSLYSVKAAPIAGGTVLHVSDASTWNASGSLYIGRGTKNFEGPIDYTSIVNNGTFYTINLSSSLKNDHLISEKVIDSQGTSNRLISAGTRVKIPANNLSPEVGYILLRNAVIPSGEDSIDNVMVVAEVAGSASNAGVNTITAFDNPPFLTATVTNLSAFVNGRDIESDVEFRDRIKSYTSTLSRGTIDSIRAAIIGLTDADDGKQVASAVITEPAKVGDPSLMYIDDGSGFEPSYSGQSVDKLVSNAAGSEKFLQLSNFPLPRPQIVNTAEAPYEIVEDSTLRVLVDNIEDSVTFTSSDFDSISSAQLYEIVIAINKKASLFRCRLTDSSTRLLLYPVKHDVETIQVSSSDNDVNDVLKFPVSESSYIKLYHGETLLKEKELSANVTTVDFNQWNISTSGTLILSVDGTPAQDRSFDSSDFGGISFNALTIYDYVDVFNSKFAGITATATTTNKVIFTSNKVGSTSKIEVLGGSYLDNMFSGQALSSIGQDSDFTLNRQNGNIEILRDIDVGVDISAGLEDTKGAIVSSPALSGAFSLSTDANGRPAEIVIVTDCNDVIIRNINASVGSTITVTDLGGNIMRLMSSTVGAFRDVQPHDFIYITNRGDIDGTGTGLWLDVKNCGPYKIVSKGHHVDAGVDTYVDVYNYDIVAGGPYQVFDTNDIRAFSCESYPQVFKSTYLSNPAAASLQDIVDTINQRIKGVIASVYATNSIKITSTTETNGNITLPVSTGNFLQVFNITDIKVGNQSHIANKHTNKSIASSFKRSNPVYTNTWLDRAVVTDVKGALTSATDKDSYVTVDNIRNIGDISEYNDIVNITKGSNKGNLRAIRGILNSSSVELRDTIPNALIDYQVGDEYQLTKSTSFSPDDNLVLVLDNDPTAKTVDISFSRTGQVNSGSQSITFIPTSTEFSANDSENEVGVDFGTLSVWGTSSTQTSTNFKDYAVWMMARNWYATKGANSAFGAFLLRSKQFGPSGETIKFNIDYPIFPNASSDISHVNTVNETQVTFKFASSNAKNVGTVAGDQFTITSVGLPADKVFRLKFLGLTADVSSVSIGDIVSIGADSGFTLGNTGAFKVIALNSLTKEIDFHNINGTSTVVGSQAYQTMLCTNGALLDGAYFKLFTPTQSVKFWLNQSGSTPEPDFGSTDISYEIDDVLIGMTDVQVATYIVAHINNISGGTLFTADNNGGISNTIDIVCEDNGVINIGDNGTSGFTFTLVTQGVADTFETINTPSLMNIFSLADTDVTSIINTINTSDIVSATMIRDGIIDTSTIDETLSIAYDHDPSYISGKNAFVSMFDSQSWVLNFSNTNPNFALKSGLVLHVAAATINPSNPIYRLNTAPNSDNSIGEYFKLIPLTIDNIKHHISHKALSQLGIVADINFSDNNSKIQLKSDMLGSQGAIEVVGGRANSIAYSLIGDSQIDNYGADKFLIAKIQSYPESINIGDTVLLRNLSNAKRLSRYNTSDTVDVVKITDTLYEYRLNNKETNLSPYVKIGITDSSASHGRPTNTVWRWTHDDSGSCVLVSDLVNGVIPLVPHHYNSAGTIIDGGTNMHIYDINNGSASSVWNFKLTFSGQPLQADYVVFENINGNNVAIYIRIDGNITQPTGTTYINSDTKIAVDILSTDSPNQIASKVAATAVSNLLDFDVTLSASASFSSVLPGDIVSAFGTLPGWNSGNKVAQAGEDTIAGFVVVKVDAINRYIDVVNHRGVAMSPTLISNGNVIITPSFLIRWHLKHIANDTKYMIESLGYNDMFRLSCVGGTSPGFVDCGVAVDDVLKIGGSTFKSSNSGEFRVLAVDNNSIVYKNIAASEELDTIIPFNSTSLTVNWVTNYDKLTGVAGAFANLKVGDWVKKNTDNGTYYRQIVSYDNGTGFGDTTQVTIGYAYPGTSSSSLGVAYDQKDGVNAGLKLVSIDDISVFEGDSVRIADKLNVSTNINSGWFSGSNTGIFTINAVGTDTGDYRPFVRVINASGIQESNISLGTVNSDMYVTEGDNNRFSSLKEVHRAAIDSADSNRRIIYLTPGDRSYKWNQSNNSKIEAICKLNFDTDVVTGIDGYKYYTGLLRTAQRVVDGFEPDSTTYPGMKAIGSLIELLPPIKKKITIVVNVTTKNGVNISEITNEIKSVIINYVNNLGVGEDVIMSDIIVRIKAIDGIEAVTFVTPVASQERISVNNDEKAFIRTNDISVA